MDQEEKLKALEVYFNLMSFNGGAYIFQIASKMNIFLQFKNQSLSVTEMATALSMQERPLSALLECLVAMGLLQRQDGKYYPSPTLQFLHGNYQNLSSDYWEHLPTLLKTGIPYKKMDAVENSESEYKTQVKSLEWMMRPSAMLAAQMLGIGKSINGAKILDVGAGSAVWSLAMLQQDSTASATALDWPAVLEVANESAKIQNLSGRFKTIAGNYHQVEIKEQYDLIILGNVTHLESDVGNINLLSRLKNYLNPQGRLIIFDVFRGQKQGDLSAALYEMGLVIRTTQGKVYGKEELSHFLHQSGYSKTNFMPIEITPYTMGMLIAEV
ncbi:MAG: hypothetical protein A2504_12480 [Bdellovibrionales bacterium RIFOXYD12_FULL_39_22]|nr:MAG: hypothetical protein A2385_00180 [Bdellovibrionales bacterium RIFOXYB1_FULL_39_21]OFZ44073.1 MAG: hypothetical protein A2485_03845 [Bdellovibrionales bacterium RIFOXYC12_FULL_39_17]OFZ48525.1 MAG: hypothetical protein A2404_07225 [Bdellovibrionales bacterium RIFOXYC1_FULL_39_130]OFZ71327.1 MAG: hypothetical protein A2451_10010 [Bdellovibrionales bacterium RIFOXYC2_FULL_39_8]OFZ76713.1 MAG: hypothetical protein A2560_11600 [Bdellovibrionales bacterium RIFOXYD1_FULL_39_84]OFZ94991.1 MAG: